MTLPVDSLPARPVKPVSNFDPNVMHTPRDYANHLNLMLDYYVDLSKWLERSLTRLRLEYDAYREAAGLELRTLESSLTASEQRIAALEAQTLKLIDGGIHFPECYPPMSVTPSQCMCGLE